MGKLARAYVRVVDGFNAGLGRVVMFSLFAMMGVLLWSSLSKTFATPSLWTLEVAQFLMVGYYILGGPWSIQLGSNVRMDLFYAGWSVRRKAWFDVFTILVLIFYLAVLIYGATSSTAYSLGHFGTEPFVFLKDLVVAFVTGGTEAAGKVIGHVERSPTAWRPYLWPVKLVMLLGFFLMLLQAISELLKDVARLGGEEI